MTDTSWDVVGFDMIDDHIALVTLRRPEARNAVNGAVTNAMREIVERIETDPDIWIAILTGEGGKAFCAGADLKEVSAGGMDKLIDPVAGLAAFVHADRSKVWIAAVDGVAVAGGFELALACDMIIASEDARFALPEVKRGLVAAAGGVYRLPRTLPRAIALELIATGETLSAERAFAMGLINRVVPKADVLTTALALARKIRENAPIAVRESLKLARSTFDKTDSELNRESLQAQDIIIETADFAEGPRAFIEKRPPIWVGR
ncbi:crotonase/enoyl-CoA hydratase family protein [soil metagenome]